LCGAGENHLSDEPETAVEPAQRVQIKISIAKQLLARSATAVTSSILFACVSGTMLHFNADNRLVVLWILSVVLSGCLAIFYLIVAKKHPFNAQNIDKYLFFNTFNALCAGIAWGVGMVLLTDLESNQSIAITFLIVSCFGAAAIISHGAYPRSYGAAALPALLIYSANLLFFAPAPQNLLGFVSLLLLVAYFLIAINLHRNLLATLILREQQKKMMSELRTQRDAIRRANENKTRFLATTSHDFAQPLHTMGNYISALRNSLTEPQQHELLQKLEASWRSMGNLLDGLLDISRLEAGAIVQNRQPVDLTRLVQNFVDEYSETAKQKHIELRTQLDLQTADTDINLFSRVVRNILSNAIKFTPTGGVITVTVQGHDNHIVFKVADTGIGIPKSRQSDIFEEYVQLDNHHRERHKGLGLGLSIVGRLCELLDIDIELESEEGKGACFTFHVAKSEEIAETPSPWEPHAALRLAVLVIDDEREIRDSMSVLLSDWGCEVFSARSGDEAVELINALDIHPDGVIADMRLKGGETGVDVLIRIRNLLGSEIPAIFVTGNIDGNGNMPRPSGTKLLTKPVDASTMHRELRLLARSSSILTASVTEPHKENA
tara:strand:- start:10302 stop:12119 length:1818 start_codon:yes stop_codon:yes gene_type:complete